MHARMYVEGLLIQMAKTMSLGHVGWDGMGWDGMGWDGMGWDGMGWDGMGWEWNADENRNRWGWTVHRAHGMGRIEDQLCAGYLMCKPWGEGCPGVPRVLSP